jgi:hypothetical protein
LLAGLICRELFLYPSTREIKREREVSVIAVCGQLVRYTTDEIWLSQTRELLVERGKKFFFVWRMCLIKEWASSKAEAPHTEAEDGVVTKNIPSFLPHTFI